MNFKPYAERRFANIRELVSVTCDTFKEKTAFQIRDGKDGYRYITFSQFGNQFYNLATYFLNQGYKGKRIAVVGKNSYQWALSYVAATTVGCVVPLDKEIHESDMNTFINAGDCVCVCGDEKILKKLKPLLREDVQVLTFEEVEKLATETVGEPGFVDSIEIRKDETRILLFTSGTTGSAKGVCLSHHNICSDIYSTCQVVKIRPEDKTLSILPIHHTYECSLDFLLVFSKGGTTTYCDGLTKVQKNAMEYQPTLLVVVPALLKVLNHRIRDSLAKEAPKPWRNNFKELPLSEAMQKLPFFLRGIVKKKVRAKLGGELKLFIVGAAALDPQLVHDFNALGIRTLQGYGLTECAPLLVGNCDFYLNPESTGIPIPGVEIKIDNPGEDGVGEILAKGENIMLGYFNDEEATAAAFRDGWFATGDLGYLGKDGELYITGRCKSVIVTENGKNIYPEELETRLGDYPLIGECLVVEAMSKGKICVKAKIFPNPAPLQEELGHKPTDEEIAKAVEKVVDEVNSKLPAYKAIMITQIMEEPFEKTTTAKVKRYGKNVE
ncbi:MAG: AMP-binding protein [Firmicutes bacterium]|nr:AMP-binding protein [Bacillota bacterium]